MSMQAWRVPVLTAAEMRAWDERAIRRGGVPERVLMETAGRAAARLVHARYPEGRVVAAVGGGNNGGDALVLLRTLRAWGREVAAVRAGEEGGRGELMHGWEIEQLPPSEAERAFSGATVLVDGLLGTGSSGAPRPPLAALIRALNDAGPPIVALDGPSGLDFTTGAAPGEVVRADLTVTFGAPKRGLLLHPGRVHAGRIVAVEIGFPPLGSAEAGAELVTHAWAREHLPAVPASAHKGVTGRVAVVAGRAGMGGAAILCGMGALRAGAGMVQIVTAVDNRSAVHAALPEALFAARGEAAEREAIAAADALVVGPAMGTDAGSVELLRAVLAECPAPVVLDADALTLLAREPGLLPEAARVRVLLTPHPAEAARLLETETGEIVRDPFAAAERLAERYGCAVLLKGAPSLVAAGGERTLVGVAGHSGVATGGMGDTMAGATGALLARDTDPRTAGALALWFCGRAAELAGRGRGLLPRDVAEALPQALQEPLRPRAAGWPEVLLDLAPAR